MYNGKREEVIHLRVSKAPEVRKQEILDTAMKLFALKGYEATSMADIAKEMNVVKGLCYRYFASKQELFDQAINQYVVHCTEPAIRIIEDETLSINEKIQAIMEKMGHEEEYATYQDFFHRPENEDFHEQLTLKMCKYLSPFIKKEVSRLEQIGRLKLKNADTLIDFILYGQVHLLSGDHDQLNQNIHLIKHYMDILIQSEIIPDV